MREAHAHRLASLAGVITLAVAATTGPLAAQGATTLDGAYAFGTIGGTIGGEPCLIGEGRVRSEFGMLHFGTDGSFAMESVVHFVCPLGSTDAADLDGNGLYQVAPDGLLTLDFDPGNPGTMISTFHLRQDKLVAITAGTPPNVGEAFLAILVKLGQKATNQRLDVSTAVPGRFHLARLRQQNGFGYSTHCDLGNIAFRADGNFEETVRRHTVLPDGSTVDTEEQAFGPWVDQPDGTFLVDFECRPGAVAPDGSLLFWISLREDEAELSIGIRRGKPSPDLLDGKWRIGFYGSSIEPTRLDFVSGRGQQDFDVGGATYSLNDDEVVCTIDGCHDIPGSSYGGSFGLEADGSILLDDGSDLHPGALGGLGKHVLGTTLKPGAATLAILTRPASFGDG